jgi:glucokinase
LRFGMDFGGTNIKAGIFNKQGNVVAFEKIELSKFTAAGDLLNNILDYVRGFTEGCKLDGGGLAIKGMVDTKHGKVLEDIGAAQMLAGKNLQKAFEDELMIPFIIDNDARAYMLGEWLFGAGRGTENMVCMTLGTGLGCSVIVQGEPFCGSDPLGGLAGGHISIDRNGPDCACGNRGCLELYCSATALNNRIKTAHPQFKIDNDPLPKFFKFLEEGDDKLYKTFQFFLEDLSIGIVNIIHAFNPEMVVLGGGVMNSSHLILPDLIDMVHRRAWTYPRKKVKIHAAKLGNKAAALGIAFHPGADALL